MDETKEADRQGDKAAQSRGLELPGSPPWLKSLEKLLNLEERPPEME